MTKVVELKLDGNLSEGLNVHFSIASEGEIKELEISGKLPPAPQLKETYNSWQSNYKSLGLSNRRLSNTKVVYSSSFSKHETECRRLCHKLKQEINDWLNFPQFQPIWRKWLEKVNPNETVRILIRTGDRQLRQLPWHLWELLAKYPHAEVALAANDYERFSGDHRLPKKQKRISILAILGDSSGINVDRDRQLLSEILTNADLTFLCEPEREEISEQLWHKKWDILFFAGHSHTEKEIGKIAINREDSLTLEELYYSLKKAVANGLKLAIFNSCDGLGLANFLEQLHLPQIIVMREPVPDRIAQQFLKYFLTDFANGEHFYLAVKQARERLQGLEKKSPGASWLPIIVQNPGTIFPTWRSLGGIYNSKLPRKLPTKIAKKSSISSEKYSLLCQQELANYIGPLSNFIIADILRENPQINREELIERLANEIPDSQRAQEFKTKIAKLSFKIKQKNHSLDSKKLKLCQQELTNYIGPLSNFLIADILRENPQISGSELIERLSVEIPDLEKAREFKIKITELLSKTEQNNSSLNPKQIEFCQQKLSDYIGPISSFLVKDALRENPQITLAQLIEKLASKIPDPIAANEFKENLF